MPLKPGTKLGSYEVGAPIGKGGMGEVYKARDTRLDRTVAIKVLPSELSQNEALRQRFEQEARAVASLNHPNICVLHDIHFRHGSGGQVGYDVDIDFMVLEYIEGETLLERLQRSPLSLEEALRYAIQIADALDKAHGKGVVHRDLKPGNIIIGKPGAKLLDFGLATRPKDSGMDDSALTEAKPLTKEGTILGTPQYMAPEQLEGKEADARTDLFAFGALLYEMLTEHKAFSGESQASLVTAIMSTDPPPPSSLQPVTPKRLDDVIARCLAKDPDARWQSAGDLAWELGRVLEYDDTPVRERGAGSKLLWLPWLVAAVAGLGALVFVALWRAALSKPRLLTRTSILAPEGVIDAQYIFAVSPDGRFIVFEMQDAEGRSVLGLRPLDELDARVLEGTEGGHYPFWSPDSVTVGFFADGRIKKVPVSGGPSQTVCEVPARMFVSGTWNEDGVILFGARSGPIHRVPAAGGVPTAVTALDREKGEIGHFGPHFFPDGHHFFYRKRHEVEGADGRDIYVTSLDAPVDSRVALRAHEFAWVNGAMVVEPGYVIFVGEDRNIFAQPFDLGRLEPTGEPTPIAPSVSGYDGYTGLSVAGNGTLVVRELVADEGPLVWRNRSGAVQGDLGHRWAFGLSHDGGSVAATDPIGLVLLTPGRGAGPTRLGDVGLDPVWSPDDRHILYTQADSHELIYKTVGVDGERSLAVPSEDVFFLSDWSPDGSTIALSMPNRETGGSYSVWLYSIEDEEGAAFLDSVANESNAVFSPDGSLLAYQSDESGRHNIYVRPLAGSRAPTRISADGGLSPEWRQDGRVTADGERFLIMESAGPPPPLTVIQNWTTLLER